MDHCWSLGPIEDDELEQIAGAVRSEDQVAHRIVAHLLDDECMAKRVLDVVGLAAMSTRRRKDVHTQQSYYETQVGYYHRWRG